MSDSQLAIVVDGGGTKTDCLVVRQAKDQAEVLARETSSGSNPAAIGVNRAAEVVASVCNKALTTAGLVPGQVHRAAFAVAGTLDLKLRDSLEQKLQQSGLVTKCRVYPDILPIALAASQSGPGVAVIAGTGSVAATRRADGVLTVLGGWGYLLGDEGSGFWIGREAVRHALAGLERGDRASLLTLGIKQTLDAQSLGGIKTAVYGAKDLRRNLASLAPLVQQLAAEGEPAALAIIESAAKHLTELVTLAVGRLDSSADRVPIALAGGLLGHNGIVAAKLKEKLANRFPMSAIRQVAEPLDACQVLLAEAHFGSPFAVEEL